MGFKYGTPIHEKEFKESVKFESPNLSGGKLRKQMSIKAMKQIDEKKNDAILRANGMKEAFGSGVSTRVLIYNASGLPLIKNTNHSSSGKWSTDPPSDRIEVGQWDVSFHQKKGGGATGSCCVQGFEWGSGKMLMVGFEVPFSGSNSAHCAPIDTAMWAYGWDTLHGYAEKGKTSKTEDYTHRRVRYSIDQTSSPLLTVIALRNDIGF